MEYKSDLITPKELADRYRGQVSERTLANWRSHGEGPEYVKVGGRVMYPLVGVERWEKSRTRGAVSRSA